MTMPQLDLFAAPASSLAGAVLSDCGRYRYSLWRQWGEGPSVCWILLNPSTADAAQDDPTVRKCRGFSRRWGYGGLRIVNLFAWRSTDPSAMKAAIEPVGPLNDAMLQETARSAALIVCAWGNDGAHRGRAATARALLRGIPLHALRVGKTGEPSHPLYLPYALRPVPLETTP